jgi:hypothetical protein
MGVELGLDNLALLGAMIYEMLGMIFVASGMTLIGLIAGIKIEQLSVFFTATLFLGTLLFPFIIQNQKIIKLFERSIPFPKIFIKCSFRKIIVLLFFYLFFFIISGLSISLLARTIASNSINSITMIIIFTLSWLVGLVTPGAPAGFGVRETVMILLVTPLIGENGALAIALTSRMVTVLGDIFFFIQSLFYKAKSQKNINV